MTSQLQFSYVVTSSAGRKKTQSMNPIDKGYNLVCNTANLL